MSNRIQMNSLISSISAKHPDAVVLACDANHLPYATFIANQIIDKEPDRQFDVCICLPDLSIVDYVWIDSNIRFCELQLPPLMMELPVFHYLSVGTYFKILLPKMFESEYSRILYLDTDTYLRKSGIQRLFNVKLGNNIAIFAAPDSIQLKMFPGRKFQCYKKALGVSKNLYFNAGVLLFETKLFNQINGAERILNYAEENKDFLLTSDQSAINGAFAGQIGALSLLWNWQTRLRSLCEEYDPHILHFCWGNKPWMMNEEPFLSSFFQEYDIFLRKHFPNLYRETAPGTAAWRYKTPKYRNPLKEIISRNWMLCKQNYHCHLPYIAMWQMRAWINAYIKREDVIG